MINPYNYSDEDIVELAKVITDARRSGPVKGPYDLARMILIAGYRKQPIRDDDFDEEDL